jgi:signal peptidase II
MQGRRRGSLNVGRPLAWLGATSLIVLILDQSSKHIVTATLRLNSTVTVIRGLFDVVRVENTGAAFGLLPGQQYLFIGISLLMLVGVGVYWRRERPKAWPEVIALGLVVGGAVGNLLDRVLIGRVTDFLAFRFFSPVFNIADSAIVTGVAALIVWMFFGVSRDTREEATARDSVGCEAASAAPEVSDDGAGVPATGDSLAGDSATGDSVAGDPTLSDPERAGEATSQAIEQPTRPHA